jgi:copper(I)-binding protein
MNRFTEIAFAAALTLGALFSFADAEAKQIKAGNLVISQPWSRQSPMAADVAAGFMTITNEGQEADRLVKVETPISAVVQLHDMRMEGDVMKMEELPGGIALPPGAAVELKPRALHIMFMGLTSQPREGERFEATLTFEKAGKVNVEFEVSAPNAHMAPGGHMN